MKENLIPLVIIVILFLAGVLNLFTGNIFWVEFIVVMFLITFYYYVIKREMTCSTRDLSNKFAKLEEKYEHLEKLLERVENRLKDDVTILTKFEKRLKK